MVRTIEMAREAPLHGSGRYDAVLDDGGRTASSIAQGASAQREGRTKPPVLYRFGGPKANPQPTRGVAGLLKADDRRC
jgi:hypothetical protein